MLPDADDKKWEEYPPHTKAKHAILIRYMGAWLNILASGARAAGYPADLVIVDAFAGRGRYSTDDLGSPLLLRTIAGEVLANRRADDVELFYIENDAANCIALVRELASVARPSGVREQPPIQDTFERIAPQIIDQVRRSQRSSFWFIDPFGYSGLPLDVIQRILDVPRAEVLVTLMVRDMNRFLEDRPHQQAIGRVLNQYGNELAASVDRVKRLPNRMQALCDVYVDRLESSTTGRQRLVTFARIAREDAADTIYYLIHATCHPRGKREMKRAMRTALRGFNAFLGANHPSSNDSQLGLFGGADVMLDRPRLRSALSARFAGQRIEFDKLLDATARSHDFDDFIDSEIKTALDELADVDLIARFRDGRPSGSKLRDRDEVQFLER